MSEDHSHPLVSARHFVSALRKFNELIPDCNAMERFRSEPTLCLANKGDGSKCRSRMPAETQETIRQLLIHLDAMDIDNSPSWVIQLVKLTNLAVCRYQRTSIRTKVSRLGQPEPSKGSEQTIATPVLSEDTIKVNIKEVVSPTVERDDRDTHVGDQEIKEVDSPATSVRKISYWLREMPWTALHYLAEYLPYHAPGSAHLSASEWVLKQAEQPLSIDEPNELRDGYLYVYWNQATFGLRKIGYTTRNVDSRIGEWESGCKHIAEEQY